MTRTLTVAGSVNVDLVVRGAPLPRPGETVTGGSFEVLPGGKGANQAVAAARAGAAVRFLGCVGDDEYGRRARETLEEEGIDASGLTVVEAATGVAIIAVDPEGRNQISVAPGANALLRLEGRHDLLLTQLETPWTRPQADFLILNPAPARAVELDGVDVVLPNEIEAEQLTGERDPERQARALVALGARRAIVTLGAQGVFDDALRPAFEVPVVDTVGAGDAFAGAFAAAVAQDLDDPVRFAQAAAALSVGRRGARSAPTRGEIETLLDDEG